MESTLKEVHIAMKNLPTLLTSHLKNTFGLCHEFDLV